MSKRLICLSLLALTLSGSSGCRAICCLHDNLLAKYKSRRWADCGCGPVYYGPWISDPPNCNDPCDCKGCFNAQRPHWIPGAQQWRQQSGAMSPGPIDSAVPSDSSIDPHGDAVPGGAMPQQEQIPTPADPPPGAQGLPPGGSSSAAPVRTGRRPRPYRSAARDPYQSSTTAQNPW